MAIALKSGINEVDRGIAMNPFVVLMVLLSLSVIVVVGVFSWGRKSSMKGECAEDEEVGNPGGDEEQGLPPAQKSLHKHNSHISNVDDLFEDTDDEGIVATKTEVKKQKQLDSAKDAKRDIESNKNASEEFEESPRDSRNNENLEEDVRESALIEDMFDDAEDHLEPAVLLKKFSSKRNTKKVNEGATSSAQSPKLKKAVSDIDIDALIEGREEHAPATFKRQQSQFEEVRAVNRKVLENFFDWEKHFDEASQKYYFFNVATGESSWDPPNLKPDV